MFLVMQAAVPANAVGATTLSFSSTTAADYTGDNALLGEGTIDWAPWATGNSLNATLVNAGSNNWAGRTGWTTHNFVVQDDGSGTNNALWVHKAHAGYLTQGIRVQNLASGSVVTPSNNTVTARVKSEDASTAVRVRVTDSAGSNAIIATGVTSSTAGAWTSLTFTFANSNAPVVGRTYSKMFFDFDYDGVKSGQSADDWGFGGGSVDISKVYMLDDVSFTSAIACIPATTPVYSSLEASDVSGVVAANGFGGAWGETASAPEGGSQGNSRALKVTKGSSGSASQTWAGTNVLINSCMDYGFGGIVTANVYAAAAGIPMMLKLDGGTPIERTATTWRAGWQQLKWDFTGKVGTHGTVAFFPNFGTADSGAVYFLDDLALNGATSPMWGNNLPNIPFSTIDTDTNGKYVHVRLQKSFVTPSFDASWWDGIWQYRDPDTKAYVKYIAARSTFSLTYKVTDANGQAMANTPVELIVNVNWSCSKATFTYGSTAIDKDNCSGGGETRLPKKNTDGNGEVTFVLTNTNLKGEAMPSSLTSAPTVGVANEIGTNIKPHVADQEGIDMLLAHFVEPAGGVAISGASAADMTVNTKTPLTFNLKDANGKAISGVDVKFVTNGVGTVGRTATTDSQGNVTTWVNNTKDVTGVQSVTANYSSPGSFPATATTTINWTSTRPWATVTGGKGLVTVQIANGSGKTAKIVVAGSPAVTKKLTSNSATVSVKAAAGTKSVSVTINGVTTRVAVTVTK
jgi:hypothetical protein